ncbi:S-adenosyl-L-methionine-dependent methyltransferase, partial [Tribonema minus]
LIDLFCGAGGFSQGAVQAGCEVTLAVDSWQKALDAHEQNHPGCRHVRMEMGGDMDEFVSFVQEHLSSRGIAMSQCHIHASPPCQPFS